MKVLLIYTSVVLTILLGAYAYEEHLREQTFIACKERWATVIGVDLSGPQPLCLVATPRGTYALPPKKLEAAKAH